jgi:fatty-acyl-CoA synthase
MHTGDLAMIDEDGYIHISKRIKDLIIRGGENISPKEIEDFLYQYPNVLDAQVIGVPSENTEKK